MRKIPTVLVRDEHRHRVLLQITPGCEWVLAGEGVATRKFDGTATMLDSDGRWWARRAVKPGKDAPPNYQVEDVDDVTGITQGWEPMEQSGFGRAFADVHAPPVDPGTYELIGPKIQGNPERREHHDLVRHGAAWIGTPTPDGQDRTPEDLVADVRAVAVAGWEGIVWHHPDGRMAKLKAKDLPTAF